MMYSRLMIALMLCLGVSGCGFMNKALCVWDESNCDNGGGGGSPGPLASFGCNSKEAKSGSLAVKEMCVERRRLNNSSHWITLTEEDLVTEAARSGGGPLYILTAEWTFNSNKTKKAKALNSCMRDFLKREMPKKYRKAISSARFTYDSVLWFELLEHIGFKLPTDIYAMAFGDLIYMNTAYEGTALNIANHAHEIVHTQQAKDLGSLYSFGEKYFPAESIKTNCERKGNFATGKVVFSRPAQISLMAQMPQMAPLQTVQIPTGTLLKAKNGQQFQTSGPGSITAGRQESDPVTVSASERGAEGVVGSGDINEIIGGLSGIEGVVNPDATTRRPRIVTMNALECEAYQIEDKILEQAVLQQKDCLNP
jgi:hypothetical protein